jgi:hypothetical protein
LSSKVNPYPPVDLIFASFFAFLAGAFDAFFATDVELFFADALAEAERVTLAFAPFFTVLVSFF